MRFSVKSNELGGHMTQLRNCLSVDGAPVFTELTEDGQYAYIYVQQTADTITAVSERGEEHAISLFVRPGSYSIWFSYSERWSIQKRLRLFDRAAFRIYVRRESINVNGISSVGPCVQLMRIEWEGKNLYIEDEWVFPAMNAAHPHIQFDRCAVVFESGSQPVVNDAGLFSVAEFDETRNTPSHTPLPWFAKLHFPLHAPWHQKPYDQVTSANLPHADQPASFDELERWVRSVVRYSREQFSTYV